MDSATNGSCFYQEKNFVASDHVEKIWPKNKELNGCNALFLTTILNFEKYKYSYGRKRNLENIRNERVLLPSKQDEFDWEFMEKMIKKKWGEIATKFKKELENIENKVV
ncbi:MAG: restriction endonuclease subunit S [Candidatus Moeniiplasma glomeromycotorum]|nr:restriction endonuclease subunit S [Candidatus Moeniiplasma glomeromycotorum]MCE8162255.1 restriction endonuclease subunit S [Candidatus Moeniiplasma glomeromycotorum]MCE8166089.1 restriction endonuclease subunit S [Candidatus Moeniiplasma glomeromycotorum]MCE8166654.1 restriction endonuclease subunit S [Candidatus Moeniiplasma glomeromycotorum]